MTSKLFDPSSNDTKPIFLRTVYDDVTSTSEPEYGQYRILKIRLFKEEGVVGHEFLILDVFAESQPIVRLLAERRPSRRKADLPQSYWWKLPKLDFRVSDGDDVLKNVTSEFDPALYYLVTTLSAPDTDVAPTFAVVCKILWEVQRDAPNYMLFRHQCYWFTGTSIMWMKRQFVELDDNIFKFVVEKGPHVHRQGKPNLGPLSLNIYPEHKAEQYVDNHIKKKDDIRKEDVERARREMRAAMKSAMTTSEEERLKSREGMRKIVQPLLTTPEAYQRTQWMKTIENIEEERQKSKEGLERVVQSLLEIPAEPRPSAQDAQYWRSVIRNVTKQSRT
ncbi:hypothetical protein JVU11DRAFT_2113 [Chiua virens]|nr:hypothetical protein JVU11DRAFT_2113 [Chiua virens]